MTHVERADVEGDEIELTAEELRELAPRQREDKTPASASLASPTTSTNGIAEWANSLRGATTPSRNVPRRMPLLPLAAVVASCVIALSIFAVLGGEAQKNVAVNTTRWDPSPIQEGEPVLIENPFDKEEVFEFPAGTTETAAREAVADILLERARERQGS